MSEELDEPFFYGHPILRQREQAYIEQLLLKYRQEIANEALKQKIWEELQTEKSLGHITIPFKVVLRMDSYRRFPPYIEVILDTKV